MLAGVGKFSFFSDRYCVSGDKGALTCPPEYMEVLLPTCQLGKCFFHGGKVAHLRIWNKISLASVYL